MIDLHTHTFFSDGELSPSELVYRAKYRGYKAIALTDHVDFSNIDFVVPRMVRVTAQLSRAYGIRAVAGAELTYVPPELIRKGAALARRYGARIVVVHGETPAETVPPGTNRAAILGGADILAHPGHITAADARLAKQRGVLLEITTRRGHKATDAHVAKTARQAGAGMVFDTDTHAPENLMDAALIRATLREAKLTMADFHEMQDNAYTLLKRLKIP